MRIEGVRSRLGVLLTMPLLRANSIPSALVTSLLALSILFPTRSLITPSRFVYMSTWFFGFGA